MAMISGLRELGRMMGFYAVETRRVELTAGQRVQQSRFSAMTDAQLYVLTAQREPLAPACV
jgi:hypothetical protein